MLQGRGFDVRLGYQRGPNGFDPSLLPFNPIDVQFPRRLNPKAMAMATKKIIAVLHEVRPTAVHLHTPAVAMQFRLIPRHFLPKGMKIFYTVHGFAHLWGTGNPRDLILERVERMLASKTDVMLFQSREDLANAQIHRYSSKLIFLGNGVGDEWFALPFPPPRSGALKAMFVGRLVREKGILDLLQAMLHSPDVELTVVGEQLPSDRGGVGEEVARLMSSKELSGRVCYLGRLSQAQLRIQMASTDVVVLPSYREGVPRSLIEGMAAGRPLLATNIRGCRELVSEGKNGFLVPVGRPDRLEKALNKMARIPSDEFAAMGAVSKDLARASHREQLIIDRLTASYEFAGLRADST